MSRKRHKPRKYIWVAYSKEPPGIPVATADTCEELAKIMGVTESTIRAVILRGNKYKHSIYAKVEVGDAD